MLPPTKIKLLTFEFEALRYWLHTQMQCTPVTMLDKLNYSIIGSMYNRVIRIHAQFRTTNYVRVTLTATEALGFHNLILSTNVFLQNPLTQTVLLKLFETIDKQHLPNTCTHTS